MKYTLNQPEEVEKHHGTIAAITFYGSLDNCAICQQPFGPNYPALDVTTWHGGTSVHKECYEATQP